MWIINEAIYITNAIYTATAQKHKDDWGITKLPQEVVKYQMISNFKRNYTITSDATKDL